MSDRLISWPRVPVVCTNQRRERAREVKHGGGRWIGLLAKRRKTKCALFVADGPGDSSFFQEPIHRCVLHSSAGTYVRT